MRQNDWHLQHPKRNTAYTVRIVRWRRQQRIDELPASTMCCVSARKLQLSQFCSNALSDCCGSSRLFYRGRACTTGTACDNGTSDGRVGAAWTRPCKFVWATGCFLATGLGYEQTRTPTSAHRQADSTNRISSTFGMVLHRKNMVAPSFRWTAGPPWPMMALSMVARTRETSGP